MCPKGLFPPFLPSSPSLSLLFCVCATANKERARGRGKGRRTRGGGVRYTHCARRGGTQFLRQSALFLPILSIYLACTHCCRLPPSSPPAPQCCCGFVYKMTAAAARGNAVDANTAIDQHPLFFSLRPGTPQTLKSPKKN